MLRQARRRRPPAPARTWTHKELVGVAARWLRRKHFVVLTEMCAGDNAETPDAIGWRYCGQTSTLVECKVSRADFYNDQKKMCRARRTGMGRFRYYLAPKGILTALDVPPSWGLLEVADGAAVRIVREATAYEDDVRNTWGEQAMLTSALRRVQVRIAVPLNEYLANSERPTRRARKDNLKRAFASRVA